MNSVVGAEGTTGSWHHLCSPAESLEVDLIGHLVAAVVV